MTDSYIVHLDQADVTEIFGALDAKIRDSLTRVEDCRGVHDELNASWWLERARETAAATERLAVELWGSGAQWLSPDLRKRLADAEGGAPSPTDSRTPSPVR